MKHYIYILLISILTLFCFGNATAQGDCFSMFGTTKDTCWSKTTGYLWLPVYADDDSLGNFLQVNSEGKVYKGNVPTIDSARYVKYGDSNDVFVTPTQLATDLSGYVLDTDSIDWALIKNTRIVPLDNDTLLPWFSTRKGIQAGSHSFSSIGGTVSIMRNSYQNAAAQTVTIDAGNSSFLNMSPAGGLAYSFATWALANTVVSHTTLLRVDSVRTDIGNSTFPIYIRTYGNISAGLGATVPTARVHIAAGTATASTAPIKFTSGTLLTTPEAGAVEYNGADAYLTNGTGRYILAKGLRDTATIDFPPILSYENADMTMTVTGASVGDVVSIGAPNNMPTRGVMSAWVSSANTVTIRIYNTLSGLFDPAAGVYTAIVFK